MHFRRQESISCPHLTAVSWRKACQKIATPGLEAFRIDLTMPGLDGDCLQLFHSLTPTARALP